MPWAECHMLCRTGALDIIRNKLERTRGEQDIGTTTELKMSSTYSVLPWSPLALESRGPLMMAVLMAGNR